MIDITMRYYKPGISGMHMFFLRVVDRLYVFVSRHDRQLYSRELAVCLLVRLSVSLYVFYSSPPIFSKHS